MTKQSEASAASPSPVSRFGKPSQGWRLKMYTVVFEADTRPGLVFDVALVVTILLSIVVVIMDSVQSINARHGDIMDALEWAFTILFTIEYAARLVCVRHPWRYATSFFGVVDLLSILPTYIALVAPETQVLLDVRILRLLRIFRIFKLTLYVAEYTALMAALRASRRKIMVFLCFVLMVMLVLGTLMYVVEGPANGYTSIPVAMYWAVVTMTTVGYGDIAPHTDLGKLIASLMMLLGWGVLAVPTGIVTVEIAAHRRSLQLATRTCAHCRSEGHEADARFCKDCGAALPVYRH
jgi:voltage-gated potassium channel